MEKLFVLPTTRGKLEALKAFLVALKIDFKSLSSKKEDIGTISDPDLIRRIDDYEQGRTTPQAFTL